MCVTGVGKLPLLLCTDNVFPPIVLKVGTDFCDYAIRPCGIKQQKWSTHKRQASSAKGYYAMHEQCVPLYCVEGWHKLLVVLCSQMMCHHQQKPVNPPNHMCMPAEMIR